MAAKWGLTPELKRKIEGVFIVSPIVSGKSSGDGKSAEAPPKEPPKEQRPDS